ncbi:hypothetical protein P9112_009978 [Eukaryota sp. TZLM1-RC]
MQGREVPISNMNNQSHKKEPSCPEPAYLGPRPIWGQHRRYGEQQTMHQRPNTQPMRSQTLDQQRTVAEDMEFVQLHSSTDDSEVTDFGTTITAQLFELMEAAVPEYGIHCNQWTIFRESVVQSHNSSQSPLSAPNTPLGDSEPPVAVSPSGVTTPSPSQYVF